MNKNVYRTNKVIQLIFIFFCFFVLINTKEVRAAEYTKEQVGNNIADWAINFQKAYGNECVYSWDGRDRRNAYNCQKTSMGHIWSFSGVETSQTFTNKYAMDCTAWINMAIHNATKIELPNEMIDESGYVMTSGSKVEEFDNISYESPKRGDIVINHKHHVMVYVGNDRMVDMGHNLRNASFSTYKNKFPKTNFSIARISNKGLEKIKSGDLKATVIPGGVADGGFIDEDEFQDMGVIDGKFQVEEMSFEIILESLKDILDWLIGAMTYAFRATIAGLASMVEYTINSIMNATTGVEASLTIEKLVTNNVPALDVNFFNFNKAGGMEIESSQLMYIVREAIASWYSLIRTVSIVGLLVALFYLVIRMIISTVSEEKAKYKEMLVSWVVSFIVVMFIHYFMVFVININESLIYLIGNTLGHGEESLYDAVRSGTYEVASSVGWPSTIIYMGLVYLLIRFLFMYIKRFLVVAILTFMAPIVGVLYSIDKIKDNKSQSLSNWTKEYSFNVLLQSVHCLLYTMMVGMAFKLSTDSFSGAILSVFIMNFILKAEKLFKKIFGIKSASIKDALKSTIAVAGAAHIVSNFAKRNARLYAFIGRPVTSRISSVSSRVKGLNRMDKVNKVTKDIEDARARMIQNPNLDITKIKVGKREYEVGDLIKDVSFSSDDIAENLVEKDENVLKEKKKNAKETLTKAKNTVVGAGMAATAVPMTIIDEHNGLIVGFKAKKTLGLGLSQGNDKKYTMQNILTVGMYGTIRNAQFAFKEQENAMQDQLDSIQYQAGEELAKKQVKQKRKELEEKLGNKKLVNKIVKNANKYIETDKVGDIVIKYDVIKSKEIKETIEEISKGSYTAGQAKNKIVRALKKTSKEYSIDSTNLEYTLENLDNMKDINSLQRAVMKHVEITDEGKKEILQKESKKSLNDVKEIIDILEKKSTTKLNVNGSKMKDNFEEIIKKKENEKTNKEESKDPNKEKNKDPNKELDAYLENLSNDMLIRNISAASTCYGSIDRNYPAAVNGKNKDDIADLIATVQKSQLYHIYRKI